MAVETRYTRREFLRLLVLASASPAFLAACASQEDGNVVNFFNWSRYIGNETLPRFARETGIQVNYGEFADEEEMLAKLRGGARGYDVIVATDYMLERLKALRLVEPLPTAAITHLGNIDPKFLHPSFDPENAFTAPYLWGATGIGFNREKLPVPPTSWLDLWDERFAGRISMLDNSHDCIGIALALKGYPETTTDEHAFQVVRDFFLKQRPLVKQYSSTAYIDGLISGEVLLAMAWSGDVLQACRESPQLDFIVPKEGSYMWMDNLCMVRGAPHREAALKLIDYLLEAKTAAEIANIVRYPTPNRAAWPFLDPDLRKDPRAFPPPSVMKRLRFQAPLDSETMQLWNETWSDIKVA